MWWIPVLVTVSVVGGIYIGSMGRQAYTLKHLQCPHCHALPSTTDHSFTGASANSITVLCGECHRTFDLTVQASDKESNNG